MDCLCLYAYVKCMFVSCWSIFAILISSYLFPDCSSIFDILQAGNGNVRDFTVQATCTLKARIAQSEYHVEYSINLCPPLLLPDF